MKVLLAPVGSRGDVQPLLVLGQALQRRGHAVHALVPRDQLAFAQAWGLPASASSADIHALLRDNVAAFQSPRRVLMTLLRECRRELTRQLAEVEAALPGHDLVVAAGTQVAAPSVAAAHGVACCTIAYTPSLLPSGEMPPFWLPWRRGPAWWNRLLHELPDAINGRLALGELQAWRRARGLAVEWRPTRLLLGARAILACDAELASVPRSCAVVCEQGAWLAPRDDQALDDALQGWLAAGEPPIYLGFGSMVERAPQQALALASALAAATGRRVLMVRGWSDHPPSADPRVLVIDAAPHARLLPRCALVVHHGGSGTSHAAMRAGVPSIVVPHLLDQFDFAHRLVQAGVALQMPRTKLDAAGLVALARLALGDGAMLGRAAALARQVAGRDGGDLVAAMLERGGGGPGQVPGVTAGGS